MIPARLPELDTDYTPAEEAFELYKDAKILVLHKPVNWLCDNGNRHQVLDF